MPMIIKNAAITTFLSCFVALLTTGPAWSAGEAITSSNSTKSSRFLLYDRYTTDLALLDKTLKDAFVFSVTTDRKITAITFDDGPSENGAKIITTLKKLGCPAAFFIPAANITGDNIGPYRDPLFRAEVHGYTHRHLSAAGKEECFADISKAKAVFDASGLQPKYFRPPYGEITKDLKDALAANNLQGILWSLDSLDWNHLTGEKLVERIVSNVRHGDIILFHQTPWTADALEEIILAMRAQGFSIVGLDNLLANPKSPSP